MIRSLHFSNKDGMRSNLTPQEYGKALKDKKGLLWVDFSGEPAEVCEPVLIGTFGFHPLAVEDALRAIHVPKLDDWDDYLYLVLHEVLFDETLPQAKALELDVFLGANYIVTHHTHPVPVLDDIWADCQQHTRYLNNGSDHILYRLARAMVANSVKAMDGANVVIAGVEEEIFVRQDTSTLGRILALKRAVLQMQRVISPQREVLNRLARDDFRMIDQTDRAYFKDVYDHLVQLYLLNENLRDLIVSVLSIYLSVINNRMNESIKILTVIATMFMPVTFIAGFFGMNFFGLSVPLTDAFGGPMLVVALLLMLVTPIGLFVWIRRRGWL